MWNKKIGVDGRLLGYYQKKSQLLFFYGSRYLTRDLLPDLFPHLKFSFLKQVHGNKIIEADPSQLVEADGQWTSTLNLALVIQTADCVPVLIGTDKKIVAVHAGWRGLEAGIVKDLSKHLKNPLFSSFGPHIHRESFEVGREVAERLKATVSANDPDPAFVHPDPLKNYVDLSLITRAHIAAAFGATELEAVEVNTFTDNDFASYRLDQGTRERQLSFVVIEKLP